MRIESDLIHEAATRQLSLDEYNELFIILSNIPKSNLVDSISPIDLVKILTFMDFDDENISDVAERIAKLIFPIFPIDFVQQSSEMLVTIFSNENYPLTLLIFNELTNVVKLFKNQGDVIIFTDQVIQRIVDIIFSQYLELSWTAQGLLTNYCEQSPDICLDIFQKFMKPIFKNLLSNTVNIFRYIDVSIEIVLKSKHPELFELAIDNDMITVINGIINSDDLLAHLNMIDVIKKITTDQVGYRLIINKQICHNLYKRLPEISESPLNTILLPGYLSLFGELFRIYPKDSFDRYGHFLTILMEHFNTENIVLRMQALEVFAKFASVPQCKLSLSKDYENVVVTALLSLTGLLSQSDPDYQSRAANAMAHILSAPKMDPRVEDLESVNMKWCTLTNSGDTMMKFIGRVVAVPIEAVKMSALTLAGAMASQSWGQRLLCGNNELIDYLMIRSDQWKSCIDLKYDLIVSLVSGIRTCVSGPRSVCPENVEAKLAQYEREGKYYGAVHHEMMVDTDV